MIIKGIIKLRYTSFKFILSDFVTFDIVYQSSNITHEQTQTNKTLISQMEINGCHNTNFHVPWNRLEIPQETG